VAAGATGTTSRGIHLHPLLQHAKRRLTPTTQPPTHPQPPSTTHPPSTTYPPSTPTLNPQPQTLNHSTLHPPQVVVPLSVLSSWLQELKRWCPALRVVRLHAGDVDERKRLRREVGLGGLGVGGWGGGGGRTGARVAGLGQLRGGSLERRFGKG